MKLGITILRGNKIQLGKYQKEKISLEMAAKWKYMNAGRWPRHVESLCIACNGVQGKC
jgi:hypothetical protein